MRLNFIRPSLGLAALAIADPAAAGDEAPEPALSIVALRPKIDLSPGDDQ